MPFEIFVPRRRGMYAVSVELPGRLSSQRCSSELFSTALTCTILKAESAGKLTQRLMQVKIPRDKCCVGIEHCLERGSS